MSAALARALRRAALGAGLLSACTPSARPEPAPQAAAPASEPPPGSDAATADAARDAPDAATATPDAEAGAAAPATRPDAGPDAGARQEAPARAVKVVTIGMHVGGGPFDEPTKEPFKKAVEPRFADFARCWAEHVKVAVKQADIGVDLLIEAAGGKPKVSNPRSTLDKETSAALLPCVVGVFEDVDFPRLARGKSGVSYSLRFTPR